MLIFKHKLVLIVDISMFTMNTMSQLNIISQQRGSIIQTFFGESQEDNWPWSQEVTSGD